MKYKYQQQTLLIERLLLMFSTEAIVIVVYAKPLLVLILSFQKVNNLSPRTNYDEEPIFKAICIGADVCNSARGMMLALGCIQSLRCNTNGCPTGVATNNPRLVKGLVVSEKWKRVKNYHSNTVEEFLELLAASGCTSLVQVNKSFIFKKVDKQWRSYEEEGGLE